MVNIMSVKSIIHAEVFTDLQTQVKNIYAMTLIQSNNMRERKERTGDEHRGKTTYIVDAIIQLAWSGSSQATPTYANNTDAVI